MMVFDLVCACGCQFEGWFSDRNECSRQQAAGLLACPCCGGGNVWKILSPVAIRTRAERPVPEPVSDRVPEESEESSPDDRADLLIELQKFVERNFEDVGERLVEEALKMHYGVTEARSIRGFATPGEEKLLNDEGVELLKIPWARKNRTH